METLRKTLLPILAVILAVPLTLSAGTNPSPTEKAAMLLERVEVNARDARRHAAQLMTMNRAPALHSWEFHAYLLTRIKNETNEIAKIEGEFKDVKPAATRAQNRAFNQALEASVQLSQFTENAIDTLNQNKTRIEAGFPKYEETVENMYEAADSIVAAVDHAESYGQLRSASTQVSENR